MRVSHFLRTLCLAALPLLTMGAMAAATITTTTAVSASVNPVAVGATTVLTATVTAASGTGPTGTVQFKKGGTNLGSAVTLTGSGLTKTAALPTSFTTVAANSITAVYAGDSANKTSTSSALTVNSQKATSTSSVVSSLNPSTNGASVTLNATVVGYTPTGTVQFKDNGSNLGTAVTLTGSGNTKTATYNSTTLTVGTHPITVVYAGDTLNNTSTSSALSQVVNPKPTTTTLTSSVNPTTYGGSTTLTATIAGGTSPTGTVTFKDGTTTIGTGTVSGTTATLAIATLTRGSHSLMAVYGGDTVNATSTSSTLTQTVNPKATTTTLASSMNPTIYGGSTTLTATIAGGSSPTGTVTFKDGTTTIGTGSVSGTTATLAIATLTVGSHNLTAVYGGDTNNATSTSSALTQTVNLKTTATAISSSVNPTAYGGSTTLTATVTPSAATGTVSFKDGSTTLGTGIISAGVATYATAALSGGAHSITAVYGGDANNATSTSSALSQLVGKTATTTTVTSSSNPYVIFSTGSVTFTATVAGSSPTGNVTFKNGSSTIATVALSAGKATTVVSNFINNAGTYSITAVYAGDANNSGSTSSVFTQVSNLIPVVLNLTWDSNSTFTATFGPVSSYPKGTVKLVMDGNIPIGTPTSFNGSYAPSWSTQWVYLPPPGAHTFVAIFTNSGDTQNASGNSNTLPVSINGPALTFASNPSGVGSVNSITASIYGGNSPTGTIQIFDSINDSSRLGSQIASGPLVNNAYILSATALVAGRHYLSVQYSGDANNSGSFFQAYLLTVNPFSSTMTLSSSMPNSIAGQSVILTAAVSGYSPTGIVNFLSGSTVLGTGTLTNGLALLSVSTLSAGATSITAVYPGDDFNATCTSNPVTQTVAKRTSSIVLNIPDPSPALVGKAVTMTANLDAVFPTAQVVFLDGSTIVGYANVVGGQATISVSTLDPGAHTLSANYPGDTNNSASTSSSIVEVINAPTETMWQFGYDSQGNPTTVIDPNGLAIYTYYDALNRPIQTHQPANGGTTAPTLTQFTYNAADRLTSVTDPRNLVTGYIPDGLGNVAAVNSSDSGFSSFNFDVARNLRSKTDARGKQTSYTYDALDRLTSVAYPTGVAAQLEYDGGSTPYAGAKGELTKISDESGSQTYTFDSAGRMTGKTQASNGQTFTVGYTWGDTGSAIDKLIAITYPSGNQVNYSYDSTGQLSSVSVESLNANGVGVSTSAIPLLSNLTTNVDGAPKSWVWGNSLAHNLGYDSFSQLISYPLGNPAGSGNAAGQLRTLTRDAAGRITAMTHTNNAVATPSLDQGYSYDNLNRVISATLSGVSTQYSYDANGNRTAKLVGSTSYTNTVSPSSNRLTQTQDVGGTASMAYDVAGNITSDGMNTFTYSDRGRMASAANAGGTVGYAYNALEQRVSKTGPSALVPTGAAYYVYDEAGNLLGEYDANHKPLYETIYLGASPAALPVGVMKQSGTAAQSNIATSLYNVYADHTRAPRVIIRPTDNQIVWRWDTTEVFGGTAPNQDPSSLGTFVFNQRFPGQVFDAETGLFDNWNRTYDARQGRYRQSDPIGLAGGINTYSYVSGNPLSSVDPKGTDATSIVWGIVAGGIANGLNYSSQGCSFWKGAINGSVGGGIAGALPNLLGFAAGAAVTEYLNQKDGILTVPDPNNVGTKMSASQQSYAWAVGSGLIFGPLGNMVKPTVGAAFSIGTGSGISALSNLGSMISGSTPPSECQCSSR